MSSHAATTNARFLDLFKGNRTKIQLKSSEKPFVTEPRPHVFGYFENGGFFLPFSKKSASTR